MNHLTRPRPLALCAVLVLGAMTVPPACAEPITVDLVAGDYSNISPQPPQALQQSFTLTTGAGLFTGNGGTLNGLTVDQLAIDISKAKVVNLMVTGPVSVNETKNMAITFADPNNPSQSTTFKVTNTSISASFIPGGAATIEGQALLESNTFPANEVDLSAFSMPGGSNFMAVFQGLEFTMNTQGQPTASWTGPVDAAVTITPSVPEPASLAAWGLTALAALGWLRRRGASRPAGQLG